MAEFVCYEIIEAKEKYRKQKQNRTIKVFYLSACSTLHDFHMYIKPMVKIELFSSVRTEREKDKSR